MLKSESGSSLVSLMLSEVNENKEQNGIYCQSRRTLMIGKGRSA